MRNAARRDRPRRSGAPRAARARGSPPASRVDRLAEGHRPQRRALRPVEHARQRFEDDRDAGAGPRRMAVVEQEDIARPEVPQEAPRDKRRVALARIEPAARPCDEVEAVFVEHRIEKGVAQPRGRTEETRRGSGDFLEGRLRAADLAPETAEREQRKRRAMAERMVLDRVAPADDLAAEGGVGARAFGDAEEGRAAAAGLQDL